MGTVSRICLAADPAVAAAVEAFLSTLDHPETAGTWRVCAGTLRALRAHLGPATLLAVLGDRQRPQARSTGSRAGGASGRRPRSTANLDTLRSAVGYWLEQEWIRTDPSRALRRRGLLLER